jgi:hypothetical protein
MIHARGVCVFDPEAQIRQCVISGEHGGRNFPAIFIVSCLVDGSVKLERVRTILMIAIWIKPRPVSLNLDSNTLEFVTSC